MNQAARCPNCRTVFRVQPQQLQASGGWARCGQCGEVFNALQTMVAVRPVPPVPGGAAPAPMRAGRAGTPLDSNPPPASALYRRAEPGTTPPPRAIAPRPPAGAPPVEATPPNAPPRTPAVPPPPAAAAAVATPTPTPAASTTPAVAAPMQAPAPGAKPAPGSRETDAPASDSVPPAELHSMFPADALMSRFMDMPAAPAGVAPAEAPSFLQAPAPTAPASGAPHTWWKAAATGLALTALLQALLIARPALSARFPGLRPVLQPLCVLMRCNAEAAPRHLAALAVESSALSKLSGSEQRYRLSLVLRNRDTQALRWPAVELRLTDAQGALLVRKVLRARELGAPTPALPAGQEQPLQALLDMGDQPVAGYSVELFYP